MGKTDELEELTQEEASKLAIEVSRLIFGSCYTIDDVDSVLRKAKKILELCL